MPTRRQFTQMLAAGAGVYSRMASGANVDQAMESVKAAIPKAEADPARPVYHFHPPANWNNDPNGTIFYKGWHHLFYQFNPYGSTWGHMHWGHARSRDLVNWEHLPIALWPSVEKGEEHVFSGAAMLGEDGRPRLFYTSIGKRDPEQWMAIPADDELLTWEKYPGNPVLTLKVHGDRKVEDWRDPFLFREAGKVYMVCGGNWNGRRRGGSGAVQLYEAAKPDLTSWKYRGPVFEYRDEDVINVECPNLFKLGAKWVLLMSPHKSCEYFAGDLDLVRGKFTPEMRGVLDAGSSYASNISYDDKGRCILWLWGKTGTNPDKGWNSCFVMPRILSIGSDGRLRQSPAPEFESLRSTAQTVAGASLNGAPLKLGPNISGDCLELDARFSVETAATVGFRVRGTTEISYNPRNSLLTVGSAQKMIGSDKSIRLRVFLDKRVIEVYVNDGAAAIFTTVDGGADDLSLEAFAKGGTARLESLTAWPLKPARFSLERFTTATR